MRYTVKALPVVYGGSRKRYRVYDTVRASYPISWADGTRIDPDYATEQEAERVAADLNANPPK